MAQVYDLASRQGAQDDNRLRTLRALYRGERSATIAEFKSRFVANIVATAGSVGYDESERNILVENELKPLIDQRIETVPTAFEIQSGDESLAERAMEWAAGEVTPQGWSLFAAAEQIREDQEIDGRAVVVMGREGERVWAEVRDAVGLDPIHGDPMRPARVTGWEIRWLTGTGRSQRQAVERITETSRTLQVGDSPSVEEEHGLGFAPVVVIPRRYRHGSQVPESGIEELVEAYLNFIWADYQRNTANKYTAFQVWGPADEMSAVAIQEGGLSSLALMPGAVIKANLTPRGGNLNLASLERQRKEALATLRELGRGDDDQAERADLRSGKAMQIGRRGMHRLGAIKTALCREGIERILSIWAWLSGAVATGTDPDLTVLYQAQEDEDPTEVRERCRLWLEALKSPVAIATPRQVLGEWQRLGLLDEDQDLDQWMADLEEADEDRAAEAMERMASVLQQPAVPDGQVEPPDDDHDDEVMADG